MCVYVGVYTAFVSLCKCVSGDGDNMRESGCLGGRIYSNQMLCEHSIIQCLIYSGSQS